MTTFLDAYRVYEESPENRGKTRDEMMSEFTTIFREKTGRDLSDFALDEPIPDLRALAQDQAASALEAKQAREEERGFGEHSLDIAKKGLSFIPRTYGMVGGAVGTVIDPKSYQPGGAVSQAYTDYEELMRLSQDKDFLANFTSNLADLREATLHILATASGYSPTPKGQTEEQVGHEVGSAFAAGAIGGTAGMVRHPIQALYGRPADVLSMVLSLRGRAKRGNAVARRALQRLEEDTGKSGGGAGPGILRGIAAIEVPAIPGFRRPVKRRPVEVGIGEAVEIQMGRERAARGLKQPDVEPAKPFAKPPEGDPLTVGDLASSMTTGVAVGLPFGLTEPAWMLPLSRYLWGTAEATPAGARNLAKLRRFFADPAAQAMLADQQQVKQLLSEPARFRSMIGREGEAIGRGLENISKERIGGMRVMVDEPLFHVDPAQQAAYRPGERLRQRLEQVHGKEPLHPSTKDYYRKVRERDLRSRPVEIPIPKLHPETARAMANIYNHMDEVDIAKRAFPEFQVAVFDAMNDGATLLMSEKLRNLMVEQVVTRNGLKGQTAVDFSAALQKNLIDRFEKNKPISTEMRGPPGAKMAQPVKRDVGAIRLPNNRTVNLVDALEGTISTLTEKQRGAVRAEVVSRVVRQAADETGRAAFERALRSETLRNTTKEMAEMLQYGKGEILTPEYAASIAKETIIEGRALNQALPRGMLPKNVAEGIRGSLPKLVMAAEERVGRALTREEHVQLRRQMDDVANRVERYEEFTDDTKNFMPEEDMKTWPQVDQELGGIPSEAARRATNAIYVSPGFNRTVWWKTLSRRTGGPVWDSLQNFSSLIKANLTVHNPNTHVGNYVSNVGLQSLRLSQSPMRVIFETTRESRKYLAYKRGERLSPMDMRTYKAIDYSALFKSDLVDAELGIMKRVGESSPWGTFQRGLSMVGEPTLKAWRAYDRAMKEGYKWGDQSFKIHEASRNFRTLATAIERMDDGEYIRFQTSPVAHTTLVKRGGKMTRAGQELSAAQLDKVLAASSVRRAFDLFVDYTQVPGLLILMRQLGPLSIASPFVTWFWRVMDFPGKKGLIYRTLVDDPLFVTSNAALTQGALTKALYMQGRRMLMFNGLRETLHDNRELMRELIRLHGTPYGTGLFYEASNPGYFTWSRMNNTDFFAPGMHTIRVISGLMAKRMELENFDELSAAQQRLVNRLARGQAGTMKDVLTMAAASGGPIIESLMQGIHDRNRYGRGMVEGEWVKTLLPVVFGQLPTKVVDVATQGLGIFGPDAIMSQRQYGQSRDPNVRDDFGPWAYRTLTGLGWRDAQARRRTAWYAKNVRREMERSLMGALKMRVKTLRKIGQHEEANLLIEDIQEFRKRVRLEQRIIQEEGRDLLNALEHEEQIRVSPDTSRALGALEDEG